MQVRSLGWEDPLQEGMATHSSISAWRILVDRGAWWITVHRVTKSQIWLKRLRTYTRTYYRQRLCCCLVTKFCLTLCNSIDCSTSVLLPCSSLSPRVCSDSCPFNQWCYLSNPLPPPSPLALNPSQHQGLFQWAGSSHQVDRALGKYTESVYKGTMMSGVFPRSWKMTAFL